MAKPDAREKSEIEQFAEGANAIQKSCACIRWDARECIEARYRRPMDDIERNSGWEDCLDEVCECRCHDEIGQLEEDIYGPPDW
jgi:hypothetical protein